MLALVLVFGPRSLRFVEYSPGILLDRFIAIGVYALRFTGPHRLATTRFPRRRPFLSSFMRDSISVDCSARCVHRFARSSGTTSTSEVRAVRGALPAHAAPSLPVRASTGTGQLGTRAPLEIPSGSHLILRRAPGAWSVELRSQTRTKPPALSRMLVDGGPAPPRSTVGTPNLITSRPAPALLHALLFLLSLSSICVLTPPAAMEPRRTPQPLLSFLPPSPPSLTRGRTRPGPR